MKPAVTTYQAPWELERFLALVDSLDPRDILEIGCYEGGTLWHWLEVGENVVAIDDTCRNSDQWETWAEFWSTAIQIVQGSSHHPDVIAEAEAAGPYDLVFIDGDHTYNSVKTDYLAYRGMVREGGAIAFHDILPRPGYGVSEVWAEVKTEPGAQWMEICQTEVEQGHEGTCGIGIAWL